MELLLFFISGLIASFAGGIVPGAVNLNIVYTTINKSAKAAVPIILAAGIGEIVLSFVALHCSVFVEENIQQNRTLQIGIAIILVVAGIALLLKKASKTKKEGKSNQGFFKGFLLAVLNPPVLIFWLLAFTYLASVANVEPMMSVLYLTVLFFAGVFIGKLLVLFSYLKLSSLIAKKADDITQKINKVIAILLLVIGVFQLSKLLLFA